MAVVELEIPPRSAYVGVARLALASLARIAGLDEETVDDLKIAISEACTNAVLSHEEAGRDDPVTLTWSDDDDQVVVEVGDRGRSYAVEEIEGALGREVLAERVSLSMALLKSLVDDVVFEPREGGGMSTRLILHRR